MFSNKFMAANSKLKFFAVWCSKREKIEIMNLLLQVERARRAIRVFFLIRELSLTLNMEVETQLPLTNPANCVQIDNVLDLSKSYICLMICS